ncbi:cupin domain-containing protein [Arthrobacter sp. NPDC056493]|uniref:cupin domain-containing protein n=1 Tax=Arthrobacter sp. NPDC056493 TaxID=3345839 RepID=UPI00366A86D4
MTSEEPYEPMRRVVTGENAKGRSVIVSDATITDWVRRPTGLSITEIWRTDSLPARTGDMPSPPEGVLAAPTGQGVAFRIAVFPPDGGTNPEQMAEYEASMRDLYGDQGGQQASEVAGMHRTDTIDVMAIIDGELCLLLDEGETVLRPGDFLVQRGTRHAWRNRSDHSCTVVTAMLPAARE